MSDNNNNDNDINNDTNNKRKLCDIALSPVFTKSKKSKFNSVLLTSDSDSDDDSDSDTDTELEEIYLKKEEEKELIIISKKINTLEDLIELGESYDDTKRYDFDMKLLNNMVPSLKEINNMIGMGSIKNHLIDHILFYLQSKDLKLDDNDKDLMHTVITGPPGVGKTQFAKSLGKLYASMGILKDGKFKKVTRSDLVAKYLGQTAHRTKNTIESCCGGVMFIDEVYALGNSELRDSFAKEAIDTLNEYLSERKNDFICIVAGYKDDVEKCFFNYNSGLRSRFPLRFHIEGYDYKELFQIFVYKMKESKWSMDENIKEEFFKDKINDLKYFGRDIENLIIQIKRIHSRRVFTLKSEIKTKITFEDLKNGFKVFKSFKTNGEKIQINDYTSLLYL